MNKHLLKILLLLAFATPLFVTPAQLKHETRGVWVATNFKIDWPPETFDEKIQQERLKQIFKKIRSLNLNTIYFQVRSNSTVIYPSAIEAFSPYFKGELDSYPSYDPLLFAIRTAHSLGLEIHAWFNVFRCFSGSDKAFLNYPNHLTNLHKNWVVKYFEEGKTSLWLDPGLPDVQNYLIRLLKELVRNYDIDGINLDYLRYPGKNFDDSFSYSVYGKGKNKEEWRRENIRKFLRRVYKEVKAIKPFIKIGVASIGIYKTDEKGKYFTGYDDVFQDSFSFLKEKIADYISPQIYWASSDTPSFQSILSDWMRHANGRNIVAGIGIYKREVQKDVWKLIAQARSLKAAGVAFFRYDYLEKIGFKGFANYAFPAQMKWIPSPEVSPPSSFEARVVSHLPLKIKFSFDAQKKSRFNFPPSYFALFVKNGKGTYLITMLPARKKNLTLSISNPSKLKYSFVLKSVDRLWNESKSSKEVTVENPFLKEELAFHTGKGLPLLFDSGEKLVIGFNTRKKEVLKTTLLFPERARERELTFKTEKGKNFISLPTEGGLKGIKIETGERAFFLNFKKK